jgi:REP element-mobilizing transposase RayT
MRRLFVAPVVDPVSVPDWFRGFNPVYCDPDLCAGGYRRHLPHWRYEGATYFVTFRLKDSVPGPVVKAMRAEMAEWRRRISKERESNGGLLSTLTVEAWEHFQKERFRRLERLMDSGQGACVLRDVALRGCVAQALRHFDGERCRMGAFVIMPNHVHAVCQPFPGFALEDLTASWKKFTAQEINDRLGRRGQMWQHESFDRIVRDPGHYRRIVRYVLRNPEKAGVFENEATVWVRPEP